MNKFDRRKDVINSLTVCACVCLWISPPWCLVGIPIRIERHLFYSKDTHTLTYAANKTVCKSGDSAYSCSGKLRVRMMRRTQPDANQKTSVPLYEDMLISPAIDHKGVLSVCERSSMGIHSAAAQGS